ncbi:MAG: hypothetical protein ACRCW2_02995 [Cellulosilyticaceae bacterium]
MPSQIIEFSMVTVWDWAIQLQALSVIVSAVLRPIVSILVVVGFILYDQRKKIG